MNDIILHLTANELRLLRDKLPGHYKPEAELVIIGTATRICLLEPLPADNKIEQPTEVGKVLAWLPRKK